MLYTALGTAIDHGVVASAQPVGLGGLGAALAKKCIAGQFGMKVSLKNVPSIGVDRNDSLLFSESQSRFVVTISPANKISFEYLLKGCEFAQIGVVSGTSLEISGIDGAKALNLPLKGLEEAYKKTLRDY